MYRLAGTSRPPPKPGLIWRTGYAQTTDEAIERLRKQASSNDATGAERGNDWLAYQDAAVSWIGLARLTGSPEDFARAELALSRAFAISAPGAGPHQTLASFEFAVHRLDKAQAALDIIDRYPAPDPPPIRAEQLAMRGDIAFFRGKTGEASQLHAQAAALAAGPEALCRVAQLQWRTGRVEDAEASLAACEASVGMRTPQFVAYIAVQRALMALNQGNWQEAMARFTDAERIFPGDWKTELRIAMMQAAMGDPAAATRAMEKLASKDLRPEVADSLANLYRLTGDGIRSREWAAHAAATWKRHVVRFPQAYWGHARDHELAFGDPKAALRYAISDARNRPYGEPLVGLARAWIANSRADLALVLLARVDRTGWKSAEVERVRAEALALSGKADAAQAARAAAIAMDPRIYDPARAYIWLDH
jgi:predicted negative regulator of RcsB-dependent stress response